jgi:perosamine synthetase
LIPIARPNIGEDEKQAVLAVLDSGMLAQGKQVQAFEEAFAAYCGVKYAIATSSGTTALHLTLLAHNIGPGDEVITSPFSFIATANSIRYTGAEPVFADIDSYYNLSPALTEAAITPRTKAIMPVHLYGQPAEMDKFMDIAKRHNLIIIEDACQAHGAEFRGKKAGSFGTGCFSFYPTKNITSGEGGMVTTNDADIADRVRVLRNHGMRQRYYHETMGYNFRMTDIHAAIGLAQLKKLDEFNDIRISNASYLTAYMTHRVNKPIKYPGVKHVFHQYTIGVPGVRDKLAEKLLAAGVGTAIYYPVAIHQQKPYLDKARGPFPVAERACKEVLSIPVHPGLSKEELVTVDEQVWHCLDEIDREKRK